VELGVVLEEGIGGKLTGLAAGAAEEIAVNVIGYAGPLRYNRADIDRGDAEKNSSTGRAAFRGGVNMTLATSSVALFSETFQWHTLILVQTS
jgi:hypothetical protein